MLRSIIILLVFLPNIMFGQLQKDAELFKRIQALSINGYDYYNIDGVTISCQVTNIPFSKRQISKSLKIDESQLLHSVDYISQKNLFFEKSDIEVISTYFC